jgi:V/A-type H+-transporting ATPase subunit E
MVAERLERLQGSADMERRQLLLGAKQACIDEAFSKAAEALRALPRDEYVSLLARVAADNGEGTEELILSAADREAVGADVVSAANATKAGAAFTLSDETRELGGGLVLKKGQVEINCAFDTRLRQLRQEMASDVARILFD